MKKPTILIISSFGGSLVNFRGDLIRDLIDNNYIVICAAPDYPRDIKSQLEEMGAICEKYMLERAGLNPLKDLKSINALSEIMKKYKVDVVFPYTIKPVVYGSIAARRNNIPVVSMITGLGFTFSGVSLKARILQRFSEFLYRYALRSNHTIVFQNKDDYQLFLDRGVITSRDNVEIVNGSGINLDKFYFKEAISGETEGVKFVIVGRLIPEKGFALFMEAARILKAKYPSSEFHILGSTSKKNNSSISISEVKELHEKQIIHHHGHLLDVAAMLRKMDVFVLPTYYREGVPRSILEALSCGLPIITTETPGCKETVIGGKNGFLIPPRELKPLVTAMEYMINHPEEISTMGLESRQLAKEKFDVKIINRHLLKHIEDSLKPCTKPTLKEQ